MKQFRKIVFWLHLITGALAGIFIFIMCVTGALLSFESNILEFAESDMRHVSAPNADAPRLSFSKILARVKAAKPDAKPSSISMANEPDAAINISFGRDGQAFINPYTGAITGEGATGLRAAFRSIEDAHRWISLSGAGRDVGKSLMDAANLLFLLLAISGLYIWFPRRLKWQNFKSVLWFRRGLNAKAREFNWHNTIGFWTSLVLIILTATAVVMSYQWANNLLYRATGNEPPQQQQRPPNQPNNQPKEDAAIILPEKTDALFEQVKNQIPDTKSVSLSLPVKNNEANFNISEGRYWNQFARSTLTLNAETGETIKFDDYGDQNAGKRLRSWVRFTHTGETGGIIGQIIGFIACVGGAFLVWTGISLSLRRFAGWRERKN